MEILSLQTFDPSDLATTVQMCPPHSVPAPSRLHTCDLIYLLLETGFLPFGSSWLCSGAWPKCPNCIYSICLIIGGICDVSCCVRGQYRPLGSVMLGGRKRAPVAPIPKTLTLWFNLGKRSDFPFQVPLPVFSCYSTCSLSGVGCPK